MGGVILRHGTFAKRLYEELKRDRFFTGYTDAGLETLCDIVGTKAEEYYNSKVIQELSAQVRSLELQLAQAKGRKV